MSIRWPFAVVLLAQVLWIGAIGRFVPAVPGMNGAEPAVAAAVQPSAEASSPNSQDGRDEAERPADTDSEKSETEAADRLDPVLPTSVAVLFALAPDVARPFESAARRPGSVPLDPPLHPPRS